MQSQSPYTPHHQNSPALLTAALALVIGLQALPSSCNLSRDPALDHLVDLSG